MRKRVPIRHENFWRRANSNFLDIAVLEWCKVFGKEKEKHYALKVITNPDHFSAELLAKLAISQAEFDIYRNAMLALRDRFIAHLDDDKVMGIPKLDIAVESVSFLLTYLHAHESGTGYLDAVPRFPSRLYRLAHDEARGQYENTGA